MIAAEHIGFAYNGKRTILEDISVCVRPGEFMAILGKNGCGKSTFLGCLDRILRPRAGIVRVGDEGTGRDIRGFSRNDLAQHVALVAQQVETDQLTVFDFVLLGRKPYMHIAPRREDIEIVQQVLGNLGLEELAFRCVDELSGGEFQKVVLARALAQRTQVLLLDEPTNNLDPANQHEVMGAVRAIVDQGRLAAAAVLHDLNLALRYCDTFTLIRDGSVYASGDQEVITPESIHAVYDLEADIIEHAGRKVVVAR